MQSPRAQLAKVFASFFQKEALSARRARIGCSALSLLQRIVET
jgi:hypothetical protein